MKIEDGETSRECDIRRKDTHIERYRWLLPYVTRFLRRCRYFAFLVVVDVVVAAVAVAVVVAIGFLLLLLCNLGSTAIQSS